MSNDLKRAVALAELMVRQTAAVEHAQGTLDFAKAALRRTQEEDLPELMMELELASFTLADGSKVEVKPEVHCGITVERATEAYNWLSEHGFGGLIKTAVVREFERGEHDAAVALASEIGGLVKEQVHPATLKSFVKEQMAAGAPLPYELFGVRPFNKAKLTPPKE